MRKFCLLNLHIFKTQQLEKCLSGVGMGIENSPFHSGPWIYVALKFTLSLSEIQV